MAFEYEDVPAVRSINNIHPSYVKFINKTPRHVELYWIDYCGIAVSYGTLSPGHYIDIDTFVTHPWIFIDIETEDRYMVNQNEVFFPEPSDPEHMPPASQQSVQRRITNRFHVFITYPMYTLQELSMKIIKRNLTSSRQAYLLDIPRTLQDELAMMLPGNIDIEDQKRILARKRCTLMNSV